MKKATSSELMQKKSIQQIPIPFHDKTNKQKYSIN